MKTVLAISLMLVGAASVRAQNYQYQYPYDPYSSAPRPQPNASVTTSSSSGSSYGYDKLLSYGALGVSYSFADFKHDSIFNGSNGIEGQLRVPLFKPIFLDFGADWHSGTDIHNRSYSFTGLSGAVGLYLPLGSRFHIFGEAGGRYQSISGVLDVLDLSDNFSVFFRPGVRIAVTESFELSGSVLFSDSKNLNEHIFELNGYYALLSVLDIGLGANFGSDTNSYHAGLRLRW